MQYNFLKDKISKGFQARRESWPKCKIVRAAVEGDYDYLNYPTAGLFVIDCPRGAEFAEECPKAWCDCQIMIYTPTPEDNGADDWVVMPMKKENVV